MNTSIFVHQLRTSQDPTGGCHTTCSVVYQQRSGVRPTTTPRPSARERKILLSACAKSGPSEEIVLAGAEGRRGFLRNVWGGSGGQMRRDAPPQPPPRVSISPAPPRHTLYCGQTLPPLPPCLSKLLRPKPWIA